MRLSTAITVALTVLLMTSLVGVAATLSVSALDPDTISTDTDQSPLESRSLETQQSIPSSTALTSSSVAAADSPPAADPQQILRVTITEDGDAQWSIESRFILVGDDAVADFNEYADAVANGERGSVMDPQVFESSADAAAERTGREMSIEDTGWTEPRVEPIEDFEDLNAEGADEDEADADDADDVYVGVISYSFTWTNFATVDNDRVYVGDAFQDDTGVWLTLNDGQRLVIERPPDYALDTPTQLTWNGHYEFSEDELEIVFVRSGGGSGGIASVEQTGWLLPGIVFLFLVGIGSYLLARRQPDIDLPLPESLEELLERVGAISEQDGQPGMSTADTDGGTAVQSHETGEALTDSTPRPGTELEYEEGVDDGIDPELLSDEERVLRMLRRNNGRMKQASIVSETGWSNAKVSQLLSQMDEDDEIEKLRIGRENLITLPDVDPTKLD